MGIQIKKIFALITDKKKANINKVSISLLILLVIVIGLIAKIQFKSHYSKTKAPLARQKKAIMIKKTNAQSKDLASVADNEERAEIVRRVDAEHDDQSLQDFLESTKARSIDPKEIKRLTDNAIKRGEITAKERAAYATQLETEGLIEMMTADEELFEN